MYVDIVLEKMLKEKIPLTRQNYLLFAFWDGDYVPSAEEEAEIPEMFQLGDEPSDQVH